MLYDVYWNIRDNVNLPPTPPEPPVPPLPPTPPPGPGPGPGPGGIPPYPGQLIRVGSRGADVQRVQRCLNQVNNAGLAVDGIFGPLTQAAVINFQRNRGLNPDGIVGPITWGSLMPACYGSAPGMSPYPGFLIRIGERGDYVRQIQRCLNRVNNAGLAEDGIFGPLTQAAVINYQRANGLAPDGIVGPITWNHLRGRCGGTARALEITNLSHDIGNDVAEVGEHVEESHDVKVIEVVDINVDANVEIDNENPNTFSGEYNHISYESYHPEEQPMQYSEQYNEQYPCDCGCSGYDYTPPVQHTTTNYEYVPPTKYTTTQQPSWNAQMPPTGGMNNFLACLLISRMNKRK